MRLSLPSIVLAACLLAVPALHAQPAPKPGTVSLANVAEKEITVTENGQPVKKRVPAAKAAPGEEVIYTSTFRNVGPKPAGNIVVTNPLPPHTTYVGGSAFGENVAITFSTDGGKTWAPADQLKVRETGGKERPAAVGDITHVRWAYRGELPPARESSVGFRVTVN